MVVNQFKIVNNDNNTGIKFHFAKSVNDNITVNNVSIVNAGQSSSGNYSRNWGGFKRLIGVGFVLSNDGTDKSTDLSSKITLSQQWDHLMETVIQGNTTSQSDVVYTITIFRDGSAKTYTGAIEDITVSWADSESNQLGGSFNLYESS